MHASSISSGHLQLQGVKLGVSSANTRYTLKLKTLKSTARPFKNQKQSVYLMGSCDLLIFKRDALSLSIKTCARTRLVQRQKFVTKIGRDTQMKTLLIACQKKKTKKKTENNSEICIHCHKMINQQIQVNFTWQHTQLGKLPN